MAAKDWFRNEDWNAEIEAHFFAKLARARPANRPQYLRIQAYHLTPTRPNVALMLLDNFFQSDDPVFRATAHECRAEAYLALGRIDDALDSLRSALAREREFPNVITNAWLRFAMLVAKGDLRIHFPEALKVLAENERHAAFPVQKFERHAAEAMILASSGDGAGAQAQAIKALEAAQLRRSGFRYHADLGLVGSKQEDVVKRMQELGTGARPSVLEKLRRRFSKGKPKAK
jgi:tetratricopeptide (TPR) repeat protein